MELLSKTLLRFKWVIFIFLISFLVVNTWFKDGILYGGAEVGLFTYNPERWLELSKTIWWDAAAPGQLIPQFIVGTPIYFLFAILKSLGLSASNIQQLFFSIMLFLMGFGAYRLALLNFDEERKKYAIFAGLFYMFNAYTLIQVWHRFLYSTIFLAAVLPLFVLFWQKWIKKGKFIDLTIFLLINFLSVYIYGNLASVITVWIALALVTLAELFLPWQGKNIFRKIGTNILIGFTFWILVNLWWIIPSFLIAPGLLSEQHNSEDNLSTLILISRQTIMPFLLQMVNSFYLFYRQELGQVYLDPLFRLIPWLMSFLIFLGLMISLKVKNLARISVILIIVILLSKGATIPFAFPYIFGFENFPFLGALRNPFEKLGIMLPLFGSLLFSIGIYGFYEWIYKKIGSVTAKFSIILIVVLFFGYAWPMIGGNIFGTQEFSVKVKIPDSYLKADQWLLQQKHDQGVILHLPFSGSDVVTYNWGTGYHGVDQNEILFSALPSLSRSIGNKRIDDTSKSLLYIFTSQFSGNKEQILRVLNQFNIKYIVLHKDIVWNDTVTYGEKGSLLDPGLLEKSLDSLDFLQKQVQFDQLVIYKLTDSDFRPSLFLTNNIQIVYPGGSNIMQILSQTQGQGELITPALDKIDEELLRSARQILVFPDKKIDYPESSSSAIVENAKKSFGVLAWLKSLNQGNIESEKVAQDLILATQKIVTISSGQRSEEYIELINKFFADYSSGLNIHKTFGGDVANILRLHLLILNPLSNYSDISKMIEENMIKLDLLPHYLAFGQSFEFMLPISGDYEILSSNLTIKGVDLKLNGRSLTSNYIKIPSNGNYEITYNVLSKTTDNGIFLKLSNSQIATSEGKILNLKENNVLSYSGRIKLEKPSFVIFSKSYHPGWVLTLNKDSKALKNNMHFLGNLYSNAWFIPEIGEYDFNIEFIPQKNVNRGILIGIISVITLLVINCYTFWKEKRKR